MANITSFQFDGHLVRTLKINDQPYFVAKDVAIALGYSDTDQAIRKHCKKSESYPVESTGQVHSYPVQQTGQVRHVKCIPESDVYRLIFRSKLPEAERFSDWVVEEVLPQIRKTGSYQTTSLPTKAANQELPSELQQALALGNRLAGIIERNSVAPARMVENQTKIEVKPDLTQYVKGIVEDGIMFLLPWGKVPDVSPVLMQREQIKAWVELSGNRLN